MNADSCWEFIWCVKENSTLVIVFYWKNIYKKLHIELIQLCPFGSSPVKYLGSSPVINIDLSRITSMFLQCLHGCSKYPNRLRLLNRLRHLLDFGIRHVGCMCCWWTSDNRNSRWLNNYWCLDQQNVRVLYPRLGLR